MVKYVIQQAATSLAILGLAGCDVSKQHYLDEKYLTSSHVDDYGFLVEDQWQPDPLYCYRTIGLPDCTRFPQHKRQNQLIAAYKEKKSSTFDVTPLPPLPQESFDGDEEEE